MSAALYQANPVKKMIVESIFFRRFLKAIFAANVFALIIFAAGCAATSKGRYFGKTAPPKAEELRYISGAEPETLDPQLPDGQPEARIALALFEGLVEYGPKDLQPIPALAEKWEINPTVDEFIFYLRRNARFSDGTPITADDFVYSMRRGFSSDTLSRTAGLGYFIKYAEEFNSQKVFVFKDGRFLTEEDLGKSVEPRPIFGPVTPHAEMLHSADRITLYADEKKRAKQIDSDEKLKKLTEGAKFVKVSAEDIGVEAIDDFTVRITLKQSAPFFLGLLAHQFFRVVPRRAIEKYGKDWTRPENIVTSGAYRVKEYLPYNRLVVEKNPFYWDSANVHLERLSFYPVEELSTMMNLYKAGEVDAMLNHSVPTAWIEEIRQFKDEYLDFPENATSYYAINIKKKPFDDLKVRLAFNLAVNREALSKFRKVTKPLYEFTPTGIFPEYDEARKRVAQEMNSNGQQIVWPGDKPFDPERARRLLGEAGFPVIKKGDEWDCPSFPINQIAITFNTNENNRTVAEYLQAEWKRNLGITIPLKTMEFKTYLSYFKSLQYEGFAILLWSGDYMDPYTFLSLEYGEDNQGGSGFYDKEYDRMLDEANLELDKNKRYEKLARAEFKMLSALPVVPLTVAATNWLKKPYVKGMYPNPGTLFPWKFVYIERDEAKWDKDVQNILTQRDEKVEKQLAELLSTMQVSTKQVSSTQEKQAGMNNTR